MAIFLQHEDQLPNEVYHRLKFLVKHCKERAQKAETHGFFKPLLSRTITAHERDHNFNGISVPDNNRDEANNIVALFTQTINIFHESDDHKALLKKTLFNSTKDIKQTSPNRMFAEILAALISAENDASRLQLT